MARKTEHQAPKGTNSTSWPADTVSRRPVSELTPYARNARKHSPEQVAQLAASIDRFGFTIPILIDEDGTIIAGHGRVLAAQAIGLLEVPVMVARGWSEETRRAYTLADNRLAENAEWDDEILREEISWLMDATAIEDVELLGFTTHEIDAVLNGWAADPSKTNVDAHLAEMTSTIKVRCLTANEDEVRAAIKAALAPLGLEGVELG